MYVHVHVSSGTHALVHVLRPEVGGEDLGSLVIASIFAETAVMTT